MPKSKTLTEDRAAALIRKEGVRFAKHAKNVEKKKWVSKMFPNESKTGKWRGKNGSYLRTKVNKNTGQITKTFSENWTAEAHSKFQEMYPQGIYIKKKKKTKKTRSHETTSIGCINVFIRLHLVGEPLQEMKRAVDNLKNKQ